MLLISRFILGDRYQRDFLQAPRRRRICFKKIMTSHETRHPPSLTNIISFVTLLFFLSLWFFSSLIFCFPVFTRTFVTFLKQINGKKNLEPVRLVHRKRRSRQKEKLIIKKKKRSRQGTGGRFEKVNSRITSFFFWEKK